MMGRGHMLQTIREMRIAVLKRFDHVSCYLHDPPQAGHECDCSEPRQPPCKSCGDRCESQMEFTEANDNKPWPYCSGCDPAMEDF